ncbi:MAG: hypothetical protein E7176_02690 [Erysipelotrichaceae bacterium]|nr:hypothetical protein [Erysipelotrichaceae bacterium]
MVMKMAWTKEQEEAIYKRGSSIIVSAGAGSGKTAVLSERILDYCLKGNDIRKVLVLTFTNAAAREMKERIRAKLLENNLFEQATYIDSAYITTFDAYSLALVKKYYYKLGISKSISIMDSPLIRIKRRSIIEGLFKEYYDSENARFLQYLKKYSRQGDKDVVDVVEKLIGKLELIVNYESFKKGYESVYYNEDKLDRMIDEYEIYAKESVAELIIALTDLVKECNKDLIVNQSLVDKLEVVISDLEGFNDYDDFYRYLSGLSLPRVSTKASQAVKELKDACGAILKNLKTNVFGKYIFKADMKTELLSIKNDVLFLLDICDEVSRRLFEYKKSVMLFDYTDIAKMAIKLVREFDDVRNDLKYFYNEILVDEYQDTSDIQEAFISEIANDNLYMVGDIKQSIYRFRNANPYIFKSKYDSYSKNDGGYKIDLSFNFRSRHEVLDNINLLFNRLMTDSCGDANYSYEHQMNYGLKAYDDLKQEYDFNLEALTYSFEDDKFTTEEIEAFITANKIKEIIASKNKVLKRNGYKDVSYSDFAILIDKAKSFPTFKKIFEYLGIPLSIEADLDLKDSILPKLFSNIVTLIYKVKNKEYDIQYKHSLAALARSFLYEYTDNDIYQLIKLNKEYPILEDINSLAGMNELSYPQLFTKICEKLAIYEKLSLIGDVDNSIAVLEYISKMFDAFLQASMDIKAVATYLSEVFEGDIKLPYKLASQNSDSVRIMTIHKSKGLEFPYCIFPLLSSSFNQEDIRATCGFNMKYGIYIPFADEGKSNTIVKTLVGNMTSSQDISEKVRLLYVALTRAREKLILILKDKEYNNLNPKKFKSFQEMLAYTNAYNEYTVEVFPSGITEDYKRKKHAKSDLVGAEDISYDIPKLPPKLENVRISKELLKLPTKEVKESIALGLRFHSALEALDFSNPNIDALPVDSFIKDTINKVLSHDIFKSISNAKTYHEHEFYFNKDNDEYHGIIDLLVVYDDHVDIIDYKLSNVDSPEYIRQLGIYKEYVKSKWDKDINIYLLSILKAEITKLD